MLLIQVTFAFEEREIEGRDTTLKPSPTPTPRAIETRSIIITQYSADPLRNTLLQTLVTRIHAIIR